MSELNVFHEASLVGTVSQGDGGIQFRYSQSWLDSDTSFPLSVSLPLHDEVVPQRLATSFFSNLLPEANVRRRICRKLGISEGNDFELLKAIGGDCAGAISVTPANDPPDLINEYQLIEDKQLAEWSVSAGALSYLAGDEQIRLSLAGAQDKLPVMIQDGKFFLPKAGSASTHILKFASRDYSHLPENETFVSYLAKSVDLPVVDIVLHRTDRARIAVVERYDRYRGESGYRRIHQEDFCQASGIEPSRKYEKEGGPGFRQCGDLIKQACSIPAVELLKLVSWAVFNLLVHNADAHGKNISLLFRRGETTVAPFYDLVCTRNYERLDRKLAMSFGGQDDPDTVRKKHLIAFAEDLGIGERLVFSTLKEIHSKLEQNMPHVVARFTDEYGESPVLERLPQIIGKRMRRAVYMASLG